MGDGSTTAPIAVHLRTRAVARVALRRSACRARRAATIAAPGADI